MVNKDLTHKRNVFLAKLMSAFYFSHVAMNLAFEGVESVFPHVFLFLAAIAVIQILLALKVNPDVTMYTTIVFLYLYFFFLLTNDPFLANYFFMLLGLPLSAFYLRYHVVIVSGVSSFILTVSLKQEIFSNFRTGDYVFILTFIMFLTLFLCTNIRLNLRLWKKSEDANVKLNNVLQETNIAVCSFDPHTNQVTISGCLAAKHKFPPVFSFNNIQQSKVVLSEDLPLLHKGILSILQGQKETIEFRVMSGMGEIRWLQCRAVTEFDLYGNLVKVDGIIMDVTMEREMERHMHELAYRDQLTGVANRYMMKMSFDALNPRSVRTVAILFIDLNSFKQVNDNYGHDVGDQLLIGVVNRIENQLRESELICRIGGDEFVILLSNVDRAYVSRIVERVEQSLQIPFSIEGNSIISSASIGVSFKEFDQNVELEEMLREADSKMYEEKHKYWEMV